MSRGSRSRKSDSASPEGSASRQIWIFTPEKKYENASQAQLRHELARLAKTESVVVKTRVTTLKVFGGGPDAHKRVFLVSPRDAGDLYKAMHRAHVLVASLRSCSVRTDPAEDPPRLRRTRRLEDFVQYKAFYASLRGARDPARILEEFLTISPAKLCVDTHDPRVLPLHVFDDELCWINLNSAEGINEFKRKYGPSSSRVDSMKRKWSPAQELHGSDILTVDGLTLPKGFHWDVERGKSAERLVTCHEVWKVGPGGYANIYPDAFVRSGSKNCRCVWVAS